MIKYVKSLLLCPYDSAHYDFIYKKNQPSNDTTVELRHSKFGGNWSKSVVGKRALNLHNDGNGYTIHIRDRAIRLDYCEAEELYLALHFMNREERASRTNSASKWQIAELKRKENK